MLTKPQETEITEYFCCGNFFGLTTWTVLGTIPGTGGHLHYHDDSVDGADRAFYRVLPSL